MTLIERAIKEIGDDPVRVTVHFAEDADEGNGLLGELQARLNCVESYLLRVPVELGVHSGPGAIGVAYHIERAGRRLIQQIEEKLEEISNEAKEAMRSRLPD